MSAEHMAKTVLLTGLDKVAAKFLDPDVNDLPSGSPEAHYYALEAALQHGFEMIDDDGDVYVCSSAQILKLVLPYMEKVQEVNMKMEKLRNEVIKQVDFAREAKVRNVDVHLQNIYNLVVFGKQL